MALTLPEEKFQVMKEWVEAYVELFPSSVGIGILHRGACVQSWFYGQASQRFSVPLSEESSFPIASLSKGITAALVLKMAELGTIHLHQSVREQVPAWQWLDPRITPHHWLCHSSGMPDYPLQKGERLQEMFAHPWPEEAWIQRFCQAPLQHQPGETYAYCNPGYWLLGKLLEKKTGTDFGQLLQEQLFGPLGLSIQIDTPKEAIPGRVEGYDWLENSLIPAPFTDARNFIPQGGLTARIKDMAAWVLALSSGKILSENSQRLMFQPHAISSPKRQITYGYGLHILERFGKKVWGHGGSHWGYRSHVEYYPEEEFGLIMFSNFGFQEVFNMAEALGKIWFDQPVDAPKKPTPWAGDPQEILPYLGRYRADTFELQLSVVGDQYFLDLASGRRWIYPVEPGKFFHTFLDEAYPIRATDKGMTLWGAKKVS
ncbi:MAG: serine hydrolase domain-containing protein [Bacteroidota bacterium]